MAHDSPGPAPADERRNPPAPRPSAAAPELAQPPGGEEAPGAEGARNAEGARDAADLGQFGYAQQLQRSMGAFSSFAIAFSLISITTGIFANFHHGLAQVGPAIVWSWVVVVAGQLLVALVLAELSTHFPLSGYGYQWTSRLVNPHAGFFVGWLLLLQFLTGFPGVCRSLAQELVGYAGAAQAEHVVPWVTVGVISVIALVHLYGIRLVSLFNDVGVIAEIGGTAVVTAVLLLFFAFTRDDGWSFLADRTNLETGAPAGLPAMALSLLVGAWCLTGFEAAADLAEETHDPRRIVPRAIITAELTSGLGGLLMLVGFVMAIPNLAAIQSSAAPLQDILTLRVGAWFTKAFMLVVFVSIFACGLASLAAATRLIFSLARDNMLPWSRQLARVHPVRQTPTAAIVVVWLISAAVVLGVERVDQIASISAVAGYLGYAGIVAGAILGLRGRKGSAGFSLGAWRVPVAVAALCWTLAVVAALTVPVVDGQRLAARASGWALAVGLLLYVALIGPRIRRGQAGPPKTVPGTDLVAINAPETESAEP